MKTIHNVFLILLDLRSLQQEGASQVVSPPEQCPERKFVCPLEVLGTIEILVRKRLEVFPLHQLRLARNEPPRCHERGALQFLLQKPLSGLKLTTHLGHDLFLLAKELIVRHESSLFIREVDWSIHARPA